VQKRDIIAFKGENYNDSIRGLVVELDGEIIGIAGVMQGQCLQAFSSISDTMRKYPKSLVKAAIYFRSILSKYEAPVYAIANPDESNSKGYLEYVGFEHYDGSIYRWQTR
jgi:hypothetical protein